jgi:hypothetical protein
MGQPLAKRDRELLEIIVNAEPAVRREVEAKGSEQPLEFTFSMRQSSWVAAQIRPPTTIRDVNGKPIRACRKSAQWCL